MIISKIQGGLGNQMFQYAYGRSLSYKNNFAFYLDKSFYSNQGSPIRYFSLDKFKGTYCDSNIPRLSSRLNVINDDFIYKDIHVSSHNTYYLNGYWQSEKYFKESEEIIRNDFSPTERVLDKVKKTPMLDTNTISLHVRRTDYVTSNGYHPVQSIEYYQNAVEEIGDYDHLFIFSDDIQWCKDNLKFKRKVFIEGFDDVEDLFIMSMCKHNIIANSSFSWWGAWLNNNPDKKVVAPANWFGEQANLNTSDMVPEKWIKI